MVLMGPCVGRRAITSLFVQAGAAGGAGDGEEDGSGEAETSLGGSAGPGMLGRPTTAGVIEAAQTLAVVVARSVTETVAMLLTTGPWPPQTLARLVIVVMSWQPPQSMLARAVTVEA